jgi:hypothetical protein
MLARRPYRVGLCLTVLHAFVMVVVGLVWSHGVEADGSLTARAGGAWTLIRRVDFLAAKPSDVLVQFLVASQRPLITNSLKGVIDAKTLSGSLLSIYWAAFLVLGMAQWLLIGFVVTTVAARARSASEGERTPADDHP